eukprot:scaffold3.g6397.t1
MQATALSRQHCFGVGRHPPCRRRASPLVCASQQQQQDDAQATLVEVTRRIRELGRQRRPREAVEQLAAIAAKGIQPDVVAATALVDACARSGKADMAAEIFGQLFDGRLLAPDEVACSVLLRALGEAQPPRWSAIAGLLNRMEREYGLAPSTVTFNQLLAVCARTNDEQRAAELVSRMEALGIEPDEYTYEAVRSKRALRSLLKRVFL